MPTLKPNEFNRAMALVSPAHYLPTGGAYTGQGTTMTNPSQAWGVNDINCYN